MMEHQHTETTTPKKESTKEQLAYEMGITKENVQHYIEQHHDVTMEHLFNVDFKKKAKYHTIVNNTMYAFSKYYFNSRTGVFQTRLRQKHSSYMRPVTDERYTSFQHLNSLEELVADTTKYRTLRKEHERTQYLMDRDKSKELEQEKEQEQEQEIER